MLKRICEIPRGGAIDFAARKELEIANVSWTRRRAKRNVGVGALATGYTDPLAPWMLSG